MHRPIFSLGYDDHGGSPAFYTERLFNEVRCARTAALFVTDKHSHRNRAKIDRRSRKDLSTSFGHGFFGGAPTVRRCACVCDDVTLKPRGSSAPPAPRLHVQLKSGGRRVILNSGKNRGLPRTARERVVQLSRRPHARAVTPVGFPFFCSTTTPHYTPTR